MSVINLYLSLLWGNIKFMGTLGASHLECSFVYGYPHLTLAFLAFYNPMIDELQNSLLIETDY